MTNKLAEGSIGLGHPDRQKGERPVGLANDEMIGAAVTLGADNGDHLAGPGVERIGDPNLKSRTPGSMTLVRPAAARAIWRSRSAAEAVQRRPHASVSSPLADLRQPRSPRPSGEGRLRGALALLLPARPADRGRARLPAVRARRRQPVLPARQRPLRARRDADHRQPRVRRVGRASSASRSCHDTSLLERLVCRTRARSSPRPRPDSVICQGWPLASCLPVNRPRCIHLNTVWPAIPNATAAPCTE